MAAKGGIGGVPHALSDIGNSSSVSIRSGLSICDSFDDHLRLVRRVLSAELLRILARCVLLPRAKESVHDSL